MSVSKGLYRLGTVIYWTFTILALMVFAFGGSLVNESNDHNKLPLLLIFGVAALVVWGVGYGTRYVLRGFAGAND